MCVLAAHHILFMVSLSRAELYTSVEELSYWTASRGRIVELMDQKLETYHTRLEKLRQLRQVLAKALELDTLQPSNHSASNQAVAELVFSKPIKLLTKSQISHPVGAFIALNRLINDLNELRYLIEEEDTPYGIATDLEKLLEEGNLPNEDDAIGSGQALLRLQSFYNLKAKDLSEGLIVHNNEVIDDGNTDRPQMNFDDLFLLGKIATDDELFVLASDWLELAIERANEDGLSESDDDDDGQKYNHLLEYIVYAAYKAKRMKLAEQMSRLWAEREPDNDKPSNYVEFFSQLSERSKSNEDDDQAYEPYDDEESEGGFFRIPPATSESSSNVAILFDDPYAHLCRNPLPQPGNKNKCLKPTNHWSQVLGMRVEILHDSPRVIRVHNLITDKEAEALRRDALPLLERSTVWGGDKFKASQSRVAKTAWLPDAAIVPTKIRQRLSVLMNINLTSAEKIQIVNYGLGGHYNVHSDGFQTDTWAPKMDEANRKAMEARVNNNRLATVLMYLEDVKAGGSTIFPHLNLNAPPIKNSAIIWPNMRKNRDLDWRLEHMGCPVLMGSKWIATIWPREEGNTFLHPCGLNKDD